MNCLQALAITAAALVMSGEPILQPLVEAPIYIARGEAMVRRAASNLEARLSQHDGEAPLAHMPDSQIHAIRRLL
jgi:hypothetical protein